MIGQSIVPYIPLMRRYLGLHRPSRRLRESIPLVVLALLALNFVTPVLRSAYGFANGESATMVLGQSGFSSTISPMDSLRTPSNLALDSSGDLWVADAGNNRLVEETNVGTGQNASMGVILGQPGPTTGFALLTQTGLNNPSGLTFDSSGNLWVTDTSNNRVLEFDHPFSDGEAAATVIGQSDFTSSHMGPISGGLNFPAAVAFDSSGDLWVVDSGNNRILEFKPPFTDGMNASLVIGQPTFLSTLNYTTASGMNFPTSARFDSSGDLWITDADNNRILEFKPPFTDGMNASLVIGQPTFTSSAAGASQTGLYSPGSLAFDPAGSLWVADTDNNRVLEYSAPFTDGMQASAVLGQNNFSSKASATTQTGMRGPTEVAFNKAGDLWVADSLNNRILEFTSSFHNGGSAARVIGQSDFSSTLLSGGSRVYSPTSLALDSRGDLWTADTQDSRVIDFSSPLSTGMNASIAIGQASLDLGTPRGGNNGLSFPYGVTLDRSGDLWVADSLNNRILEFKPPLTTGINASVVIGQQSFTTFGNSTSSTGLSTPTEVAFDSSGDLWVADAGNDRILEFRPPFTDGMNASMVLGQTSFTSSVPGVSPESFYSPIALAFDSSGDLWVADSGNSRVLEFPAPLSSGESALRVIGQSDFVSRSPALSQTGLYVPEAITFDGSGNLWVSDTGNDRVLEFETPFSNGQKASVVLGQTTFTTDLPATNKASLINPEGLVFDSSGNLWIADASNNRIVEFPNVAQSASSSSSTSTSSSSSTSTSSSMSSSSSHASSSSSSTATLKTSSNSSSVSSRTSSMMSSTSSSASTTTSMSSISTTSSVPEFPIGAAPVFVVVLLVVAVIMSLSRRRLRGAPLPPAR
jgi:sugar lactone lactonase YvrE